MIELIQAIRERKVILFVGAGVSRQLGLPSWSELVSFIAKELGYDPNIYKTLGDHLSLAEYYVIKQGDIGPFRSYLDRTWHTGIDITKSELHNLIVDLNFPIIYTTNYDRWIEFAYDHRGMSDKYIKIIDVSDIPKITEAKTQIVKFHGDFDKDTSIVLTESHYFERLNFESALDIKLRSDALGKSLLFIGYSLSDINLRLLLYKLKKLWETSSLLSVKPKSYIFLSQPNPVQEEILTQRGIHPIVATEDDPSQALVNFLKALKS